MRKLTVLYDASCGFCTQCRWWMEKQPAFLELEFVPAAATDARRRFPSLSTGLEELVAVDDEGGVYRGARAFVICLYALREYRELSMRLGSPVLLPFARMALKLLSRGRRRLSRWLGMASEEEIVRTLQQADPPTCERQARTAADSLGDPIEVDILAEGATCGVCVRPIAESMSTCKRCLAAHHPECWVYLGKCSTYGCGSIKYRRLKRAL